jgi:hypothetical protein
MLSVGMADILTNFMHLLSWNREPQPPGTLRIYTRIAWPFRVNYSHDTTNDDDHDDNKNNTINNNNLSIVGDLNLAYDTVSSCGWFPTMLSPSRVRHFNSNGCSFWTPWRLMADLCLLNVGSHSPDGTASYPRRTGIQTPCCEIFKSIRVTQMV